MAYWLSLCVLRGTCRQNRLYETLFYTVIQVNIIIIIIYRESLDAPGGWFAPYMYLYKYMYICICICICVYIFVTSKTIITSLSLLLPLILFYRYRESLDATGGWFARWCCPSNSRSQRKVCIYVHIQYINVDVYSYRCIYI
jgi:hypothetical protein